MKIWIHVNGVQEGPFELNELPLNRMDPETPVWYEGLTYWTPAGKASVTAGLFVGQPDADMMYGPNNTSCYYNDSQAASQSYQDSSANNAGYAPNNQGYSVNNGGYVPNNQGYNYGYNTNQPQKAPSAYIVWSVLLTVLCCNPIGIIPIITGTMVNSKFRNFDFDGAQRMSETTAWWLMITIVTSLIFAPFSMLMSL